MPTYTTPSEPTEPLHALPGALCEKLLTRLSAEAREMSRGRMHELRKALEQNMRHPEYIITVRDVGYRLVP